ncbi:EAL domain-containing protein [Thalassiella azotivora]
MTTQPRAEHPVDLVDEVLAHPHLLSLVYQPIVDLERGELVGYEALTRLPGSQDPRVWFEHARDRGLGVELELVVVRHAVERLPSVPRSRFLAVNLSLAAVADPRTTEMLSGTGDDARRLLLEITDPLPLGDVTGLVDVLAPLRRLGVLVAVHVGPWEQALTSLQQVRPDVVKVRSGLEGGATDVARAELAHSIARYGQELGADVVVTVVEGAEDLWTVSGSRAAMAQGYLLGRPDVVMTELSPQASALVHGRRRPAKGPGLTVRRRPAASAEAGAVVDAAERKVLEPDSLGRVLEGLAER